MASADIDGTGRREGEPVMYRWPWYWHLPRLAPWLLLSLAIIIPAANRDRRALPIFLPALTLMLLWHPAEELLGMDPITAEETGMIFDSLVFGIALLWLNIDKIARCSAFMRLVVSLGVLALAGWVASVSHGGTFSGETPVALLGAICLGIVELVLLAATRRLARRRCDPVRFMVWLGIGGALFSAVGIAAFDAILALLEFIDADTREILATGLFLGLCLGLINLAYVVLMSASPFFRRPFVAWLDANAVREPICSPEGR